jgi:hypothetical protein
MQWNHAGLKPTNSWRRCHCGYGGRTPCQRNPDCCGELALLRSQAASARLECESVHDVFRATVLSRLLYCSCAWSGFCSAEGRARLEAFIRKCKRLNLCSAELPAVSDLFKTADTSLFTRVVSNSTHVLRSVLLPCAKRTYFLRKRTHDFELLTKSPTLDERNFTIRMLYKDIY